MPTAGVVSANLLGFYIGGVFIGCQTGSGFDFSRELIETVCKSANGNNSTTKLPGSKSHSFSADGNWAFDATYGIRDILAAFESGALVVVRQTTGVTGDMYLEGNCYITSVSGSADTDSPATFSATFEVSGDITIADES